MKIRRTISIDKSDFDMLKPLLDSNGNNLSHALRQLINEHRQKVNMGKISDDRQKIMMLRNQIIENRICALIPYPLLQWLLKTNQCVPPLGTFRVIMEKYTKLLGIENFTFNDYFKMINSQLDIFGYQYRQNIEVSSDLRNIRITFEGENTEHLKGVVINYSCLLSHYPIRLKTKKFMESPNFIIVDYEPCNSEEEAFKSVIDQFGDNQFILEEIQSDIKFWRRAINILKTDHYEDVIISRSIFLQITKSCEFSDQLCNLISIIYSMPVEDTDYKVLMNFIEEICKTNGLIHKIEHNDNEIRIYHAFEDKDIICVINDTII
ncbi:MAG TPA: hypothetical protein VIO11_04235, partial [Candidatus Methanoperedens sp.]